MAIGRETTIGIGAAALGVACMAVDHLVGTEPEPGEDDSFPVDPAAFALGSGTAVVLTLALVAWLVPRTVAGEPERVARTAIVLGALGVVTVPLVFLAVPFPLTVAAVDRERAVQCPRAGAAVSLGLRDRATARRRRASAAVVLGSLVLALLTVTYAVALAT